MEREVAYQGSVFALFRIAGDHGKFFDPEKFGDLGGGLFEFKSFHIRMPFAYAKSERGLILITHGFIKKKAKTPKEEIARAWRIYGEDQAQARLTIVGKRKR
jgi:phage-related protein